MPNEPLTVSQLENLVAQPPAQPTTFVCVECSEELPLEGSDSEDVLHLENAPRSWRQGSHRACRSCFDDNTSWCNDCENSFYGDMENSNASGDGICESCAENYRICRGCDELFHRDDTTNSRCESCNEEYEEQENCRVILNHSAKPNLSPLGTAPYFLGVELEVECDDESDTDDKAVEVKTKFKDEPAVGLLNDFVITKHDGSLKNGFEIVTRPASIDFQKAKWDKFFESTPGGIFSWKAKQCGLHVHVSRSPMTELQIAKMIIFVNASQNRAFIEKVAGRPNSEWAGYSDKKIKDISRDGKIMYNPNRYEAVNVQNKNTVEFRIFKGTLRKSSFYRALEFADAVTLFCFPTMRSISDCQSKEKFFSYIFAGKCPLDEKPNVKRYPNLCAFLTAKGFYDPK